MERRVFFLCLLSFLMFAEGLSWIMAGGLGPCLVAPEHSEQAANNDNHQDCPTFFAGTLLTFERGAEILKRNDNDKAVVAGFTIVLAISTIGLWLATNRLWAAGERQLSHLSDTAERQLRAYITLKDAAVFIFPENQCRLVLKFVNSGQTPAYNFRCWHNIVIASMDGKPPFDNSGKAHGASITGAGDFNYSTRDFSPSVEQIKAIEGTELALFVWGRVSYEDAFENARFFHFRLGASGVPRAMELELLKGLGWPLVAAGHYTDEYQQPADP